MNLTVGLCTNTLKTNKVFAPAANLILIDLLAFYVKLYFCGPPKWCFFFLLSLFTFVWIKSCYNLFTSHVGFSKLNPPCSVSPFFMSRWLLDRSNKPNDSSKPRIASLRRHIHDDADADDGGNRAGVHGAHVRSGARVDRGVAGPNGHSIVRRSQPGRSCRK